MKLPVVYGVTHDPDTEEMTVRVPRATKVTIGKAKDSGLHVFKARMNDGSRDVLVLEIGRAQKPERRLYELDQIQQLEQEYAKLLDDASVVKRRAPEKLPYFSFMKERGDGTYIHDIQVIAKHPERPRRIDIVITDDQPMVAEYQYWDGGGRLRCSGDGINARRNVTFTPFPEDVEAAEQAIEQGRKWFPIMGGCFTKGCAFSKPGKNKKGYEVKQCGLHGSFGFQLVNDIRLGAKAEFTTTGGKSVRQLVASLIELATFTGGGDPARGTVRGIPLELSVSQFKTNHNGQPGTAYAVRVELRAESIQAIRAKMIEAAKTFGGVLPPPVQQSDRPMLEKPAMAQLEAGPAAPIEPAADPTHPIDAEFTDEGDDAEVEYNRTHFVDGDEDGDDEDTEAQPQEPGESFDDTKAAMMAEAEAAIVNAGEQEAAPVAGRLFPAAAEQTPQGQYVDPGEQNEQVKGKGKVRF